ncbi:GMC family oxidoreductase [Pusillimonas sp. CC-YST705]|uniref:GMC family oxidoreductase n=1 Tax=Mesopusillimonas faecipullorum TaxID=2755040 RepID=A0ABS8CEV1_9BURK|nr:GMC family oxidoreductase [Mesopusillimonas faecipullorum]MCB5364557.1 GMC family oxidoreductase [Mesopusillimonas faecipullorum]
MRTDANTIAQGSRLHADLCIVGAGAAGISLALALGRSGLDIILLESGTEHHDPATQALYEGTVADERLHSAPDTYRVRRFGGSTTLWGGRCMPMDPIDFERRDYIPDSGWPFDAVALLPYYKRANRLCEAGEFAYTAERAFPHGMKPMIGGFESPEFSSDQLERFSCPTDFGRRYRRRLEEGSVRVLVNANFYGFERGEQPGKVGAAMVRTLKSVSFSVQARAYVIAAGGLETPRLLLSTPGESGRGLGNMHDVVGRYYMCHLAGTIGTVDLSTAPSVWHGYQVSDDGVYCRRRLALTPQAQRLYGVGNFIARLHHPRIPDAGHGIGILSLLYLARPAIPYEYAKRLYEDTSQPGSRLAHLSNVITGIPGTAAFLWHWLRYRTLAERKFPSIIVTPRNLRFSLDFHAEQVPNRASRVTLGSDTDALGMRKIRVDWRYTLEDVRTVSIALERLAVALQNSGLGRFEYDPQLIETEMTRYGAYGGHHIGTARMGTDPRHSVVDTDCRLHEADNVFLAGASVFPTSSQANPTLTIVALALRLADHLHGQLSPEPIVASGGMSARQGND